MTMKIQRIWRAFDDVTWFGNIDSPRLGAELDQPCVEVMGWAVHAAETIKEIRVRGKYIDARAMAYPRPDVQARLGGSGPRTARCGFHLHLWDCDIADDPVICLHAVFGTGDDSVIARLTIEALRPAPKPLAGDGKGPLPTILLVSNIGRSGSSLLMGSLLKHPRIGGSTSPSYESHLVQAYTARLKLSILYTFPMVYFYRPWFNDDVRGMELYGITGSDKPLIQPFLIERHMAQFSDLIRSYLSEILNGPDGTATIICEKATQPEQREIARFLSWHWEGFREIVLVRDPRDLICSYVAFDDVRGIKGQGFSKGLQSDPDRFFRDIGRRYHELILRIAHGGSQVRVVRYEDLMENPRSILINLFNWLGIDSSAATMDLLLDASDLRYQMGAKHITSTDARSSVGRWQRDLPRPYLDLLESHVREQAEYLGYEWAD